MQSSIEAVITDLKAGRPVIVVDDATRENEGDLVMPAEVATPEWINFMVKYGRGLICVPMSVERAQHLNLNPMVRKNRDSFGTAFTVSVDAACGVSTGISAFDRSHTIKLLADSSAGAEDFVQPGHIFPLIAKDGGVLRRAGHTEAAVDLARLAGFKSVGVICEILNDDGSMARMPELQAFAAAHNLNICTIADLIAYRRRSEKLVTKEEVVDLPTRFGDFKLHLYRSLLDDANHLAIVKGEIDDQAPVLVRVHSECLTGDVFGSCRCDCGPQLEMALQRIEQEGRGVLLYMRQEGRGIGLPAKIQAYKLQEQGLDTVEANLKLGFPMDLRDYGIGAQILSDLGAQRIRLMTNNPKKMVGLEGHSLEIVEQIPIKSEPNIHNIRYLEAKRTKMGHRL